MSTKLVTVYTYDNPHTADLAKMFIEQADIPVVFDNRNLVEMDWLLSNAVGNIRLQVPYDRAEEARLILEEMRARAEERSANANACIACTEPFPQDADTCPHCGWSYNDEDS